MREKNTYKIYVYKHDRYTLEQRDGQQNKTKHRLYYLP